jgi:prepilin-type N-terminal cleavage/methylation domain-containing protein
VRQPFSKQTRPVCLTRRGFSLIEIMVAVTLLTFILVGLLAMFYQVQRAFRSGTQQADIMEGGRATMALIVRDLQEMVASHVDLSPAFYVTNFAVVPGDSVDWRYQTLLSGNARPNLLQEFCFLIKNGDSWSGIAYRFAMGTNDSDPKAGVSALYRSVTTTNPPSLDFLERTNALRDVSRIASDLDFANLLGAKYHRVVDGVVSLTITPCDANGIPFNTYDNTNSYNRHFAGNTAPGGVYAFMADALPAYVDVELAVMEPSTLAKYKVRWQQDVDSGYAVPWRSTNYLAQHIGQTHVFRQRVPIRPVATDPAARF